MTRARDIANLVDANGDIVAGALDNVPAADVVNDTTPQLGGNLDLNSSSITGTGDVNITGRITSEASNSTITSQASGASYASFIANAGAGSNGYVFFQQSGTEMSRITAENGDNLAFSTGSSATERMRVTAGGSLAINTQSSPFEKVNLHDGNIRLSGTDDARIQFLNSPTSSYSLGSSGGAAIRFHRPSSGHEAIAFETHDTGVSHAERMRIHPEGYITMPYTPIVALQDKGTSSSGTQVITGWSVTRNNGNHFNNSTGLFTCPVAGYYEINYCAQSAYPNAYNWIAIFHNGGIRENIHWNPDNNSGHYNLSLTHVLLCGANDTLGVGTHNVNSVATATLSDACATIKLIG